MLEMKKVETKNVWNCISGRWGVEAALMIL